MNFPEDREILKLLREKLKVTKSTGEFSYVKANKLYEFYLLLRKKGWNQAKEMHKSTFNSKVNLLINLGIYVNYLKPIKVRISNEKDYFTITAKVDYLDVPLTLKNGWVPGYGDTFLEYGGIEPRKMQFFVSENGRLCKKCSFIGSKELAEQFRDHLGKKLAKRYKNIELEVRTASHDDLCYRKKNAEAESIKNDEIIRAHLSK